MEKKLLNPKKVLKRLISKLQRLKLPHFKPKALANIIHHDHKAHKGVSLVYMNKFYIESSPSVDGTRRNYFSIPPEAAVINDHYENHHHGLEEDDDDDHHHHHQRVLLGNSAYMSLKLHGVDAKAEEFIRKRKEAWMIERQKSAEEFLAMLARGT